MNQCQETKTNATRKTRKTSRSSHLVHLWQETMPSRHSASSMRATFRASAMPSVRSNEALKERKAMESIGNYVFATVQNEARACFGRWPWWGNESQQSKEWHQAQRSGPVPSPSKSPFWPQFAEVQTWMHRTHVGNSQELADWQTGPSEAGIQQSLVTDLITGRWG